jgi:hypothetical protein
LGNLPGKEKMNPLRKILGLILLVLVFCHFPSLLQAAEITPFYTQNQSPLIQIFGLPSIGEASLLGPGKTDARFIVDLANNYVDDQNPRESILLDGESTRLSLDARYGIKRDWEIGMVIPFVIQSGGFLDGFIENYHSAFGFPQGGREQAPRNRLLYRYVKDGQERLKVNDSSSGLGDISLNGGWQIWGGKNQPSAAALRANLKLPTGSSGQLHGSGSWDVSLWGVGSHDWKVTYGHLTLFGAAGLMGMTGGDVLESQQRNWVGFGGLGVGWSPVRWIAFKVQANGHTSFYKDSGLRELNMSSIQLTIGGTLAFSEKISLDLGVTEDVIVKTSPDVVFHLALRGRF